MGFEVMKWLCVSVLNDCGQCTVISGPGRTFFALHNERLFGAEEKTSWGQDEVGIMAYIHEVRHFNVWSMLGAP